MRVSEKKWYCFKGPSNGRFYGAFPDFDGTACKVEVDGHLVQDDFVSVEFTNWDGEGIRCWMPIEFAEALGLHLVAVARGEVPPDVWLNMPRQDE